MPHAVVTVILSVNIFSSIVFLAKIQHCNSKPQHYPEEKVNPVVIPGVICKPLNEESRYAAEEAERNRAAFRAGAFAYIR